MGNELDEEGQPPKRFYADRVSTRLVSELLGLCKGMILDGNLSEGELAGLRRWLGANPDAQIGYPGQVIAERLVRAYEDGVVSEEERAHLSELLLSVTGETEEHDQPLNLSARLPLDDPPPTILFDGYEYVFTGKMLYGTRTECERLVQDRGARIASTVTKKTGFLVVGPIGSHAWLESTHGRKILRAVELRREGTPIRIVCEENWLEALDLV